MYTMQVDSSQGAKPLLTRERDQFPESWSPGGQFLAYREVHPVSSYDIWMLPTAGGEPRPFVVTPFNDRFAQFSPNGAWVAYASDQSGRDQVYVCAFPECDRRQTVSLEGGSEPRWSPDGKELFFRNGRSMWVVEVVNPITMELGMRRLLFDGLAYQTPHLYLSSYGVHPDGQRFVMITDTSGQEVRIVQHWFEELKRLVPMN
jgi:Tol biopolymer transport system component